MPQNPWVVGALSAFAVACSTLVGADFDDRAESSGGNGGLNSGGTNAMSGSGGANTGGGESGSSSGATGGSPTTNGGNGGQSGNGGRSGDGGQAGGGQAGGGSGGAGDGGGGVTAGDGGFGGEAGNPDPAPIVVVNEIQGQGAGDDFIELYNRGPGSVDLEAYGVSDSNHTFVIPSGITLAEGGYLLFLLNQTASSAPFTCFTTNPCFHVSWGVAQTGEAVSLRNPLGTIIDATIYPSNLANGQTWGRIPNGIGPFEPTTPTHEAANTP